MREAAKEKRAGFAGAVIAVAGWLVCAAMCFWLNVALEGLPRAAALAYPLSMAVAFSNIFVFSLVRSRCAGDLRRLLPAVIRICLSEGSMLLLVWSWGRYWMAA